MTKEKLRRISVLGSTGTIGLNTLEIVRRFPGHFKVVSLSAGRNLHLLREQIAEFAPEVVSVLSETDVKPLVTEFPKLKVAAGNEGPLACIDVADTVVVGIVGFAGLVPTLHAIRKNKRIGLANKESLVVAGHLMMAEARDRKVELIPVDSEHSGLFQLLQGHPLENIGQLILTASGGPFYLKPEIPFEDVTPEMAIKHPNWKMGPKISVDSATLMNKGLELLEAQSLFGVTASQLGVWVHPQSVMHALIQWKDGSSTAQFSVPDMKGSIAYSLSYPERLSPLLDAVGPDKWNTFQFFEPDLKRFRCLKIAMEVMEMAPSYRVVLNAANERAVDDFLNRRISFSAIPERIETRLAQHQPVPIRSIEDILALDLAERRVVY